MDTVPVPRDVVERAADEARFVAGRLAPVLCRLDEMIGDTDPNFPDDWTDEDMCEDQPEFWCYRQLQELQKHAMTTAKALESALRACLENDDG